MEEDPFSDSSRQKTNYCVFFTEPTFKQTSDPDESKNKIEINETIHNAENIIYKIVKANLFAGYKDITKFKDSMFKFNNSKLSRNKNLVTNNKRYIIKDKSPMKTFNTNNPNKLKRFKSLVENSNNNSFGNNDSKEENWTEKKNKEKYGNYSIKSHKTKKEINDRIFPSLSVDNAKNLNEKAITLSKKRDNSNYNLYETRSNLKQVYRNCIKQIKNFHYLNTHKADIRSAKLDSGFEKLINPKKEDIIQKDILEVQSYSNKDEMKKSRLKDILFTKSKNDAISNLSENFAYNVNKPLYQIFSTDFEINNRDTMRKLFEVKDKSILSKLENDNRNKKMLLKRLDEDFSKYKHNGYFIINKTGEKFQYNKVVLGGLLRNNELPIIQDNSYFANLYNSSRERMDTNTSGDIQKI